jgi:hypothetical protein
MMEWMPIETAPKDGTRIIMADASDVEMGVWVNAMTIPSKRREIPAGWEDDRYVSAQVFEPSGKQPTHWMPLPAPPPVDQRQHDNGGGQKDGE